MCDLKDVTYHACILTVPGRLPCVCWPCGLERLAACANAFKSRRASRLSATRPCPGGDLACNDFAPTSPHGLQLTMEPSEAPSLMLQAEKALPQPIHPRLISYCPTMDLVAVVSQEETLDVYRFNGQRAFGLKRKSFESKVDSICWKFNGKHRQSGAIAHFSARDPLRPHQR